MKSIIPEYTEEQIPLAMEDGCSSMMTAYFCKKSPLAPVIICTPASGVPARFYKPLVRFFIKAELNAITSDLRGVENHSLRASRKTNFGYHEMITYDLPVIVNEVRNRCPDNPIFLFGHSMGGHLNALYSCLEENHIKGLIFISSPSLYYKTWGKKYKDSIIALLCSHAAYISSLILGYFPGQKVGIGGMEARNVVKDWATIVRTGRYAIQNSKHDFEKLLGKLKKPALAISLDGDPLAPKRAVKHFLRKMSKASITYIHITAKDLRLKSHNHFNWIRRPGPIVSHIKEWLNSIES